MALLLCVVVALKSARAAGMIGTHVSYTEGKPRLLHVAGSGFQRAARDGKPHCTHIFQVSSSVMFVLPHWPKEVKQLSPELRWEGTTQVC